MKNWHKKFMAVAGAVALSAVLASGQAALAEVESKDPIKLTLHD